MAIRGSLKEASLPDVLQLLSLGKKTGCLSVSHRSSFGYIYFGRGRIIYASIVNRRDRLGDMLLRGGLVTQRQLDAAIDLQGRHRDKRLGELLVHQGAITDEQLKHSIRVQIEEAVYFLFTWTQGTFNFEPDVAPDAQDVTVSINPETLLLEGARRVDEWGLIEKKIPSFDIVFDADRSRLNASDATLTPDQVAVLGLVDGARDVQGIINSSGLVEFDVAKALYGLATAGFIQRVATSARPPGAPATPAARVEEHRNLGVAFFRTAMLDEALREFRRVLDLSPKDLSGRIAVGLVHARKEEWTEAAAAFGEAIMLPGAGYQVHHDYAVALERSGRLPEARSALMEAFRLGADSDPHARMSLGIMQLLAGETPAADETLRLAGEQMRAEAAAPSAPPEARSVPAVWFHYAGLAAAFAGDLSRAAATLAEGAESYPRSAVLANNLAVVLERSGAYEQAFSALDRGLHDAPTTPQLLKNLGDLNYRAGRFDEALEMYGRASGLRPDLGPDMYARMGNIHLRRHEIEAAVRCWEQALAIDPSNEIVRANLASVGATAS